MDTGIVLVTGASGFLATHIVKQLLEQGYRVRGTVRSLKDEKKCAPLRQLVVEPKHPLELVEADLLDENSWIKAVVNCEIVIHTASPVPKVVPKDEDECVKPAVDGTLFVLKACADAYVKRVVITSSTAAIAGENIKHEYLYTEADWGDDKTASPYTKSKILAEKAAWKFVEDRKAQNLPTFELATINPGLIAGPVLHDVFCSSMELFKRLLERQMMVLPDINFPLCDVRDVAAAHIKAMILPEAVNKRHIIVSKVNSNPLKEIALILQKEFGPKGYSIPTMVVPSFLVRLYSYFDGTVKLASPFLGVNPKYDNKRFIEVLGIKPHEIEDSLYSMAYTMIDKGFITKRD